MNRAVKKFSLAIHERLTGFLSTYLAVQGSNWKLCITVSYKWLFLPVQFRRLARANITR